MLKGAVKYSSESWERTTEAVERTKRAVELP